MIRFECKLCRREIEAPDDEAGKNITCPYCSNEILVPTSSSSSSDNQEDIITDFVTEETDAEEDKNFFDLRFTEIQLFSMSVALLILYSIDSDMHKDLSVFFTKLFDNNNYLALATNIIFLILPFSAGLFLSIYNAFRKAEKSWYQKSLMLFFAVFINAGTGLYLGWFVFQGTIDWWLLLFAVWNIIYSLLVVFKFFYIGMDESGLYDNYVSDIDATIGLVILTFIVTVAILLFCKYRLELFWVINYSICITFISFSDAIIRKMLVRKYSRLTE
jgi:DNA-directed RNA polymerase subunit RPC12/RpoP